MKLYNAGLYTSNFSLTGTVYNRLTPSEQEKRRANKWFLESYHYIGKGGACANMRRDGVKIFLDSGAFSAFKLGVEIDIGRYCDFALQNDDLVARDQGTRMIAPLDVIGEGAKGAELSFKNMEEMERRGVQPLPCFHFNEPWEYFDHYIANYDYIALGGLVRNDLVALVSWFKQVFERIAGPDGKPKVRLHGFSLTALGLMLEFPWYSVDSSTWVQWSANGLILMPTSGKQMHISDKSSARKIAMQHYDSLPPIMQHAVAAEIEADGQDVNRLRENYFSRWAYNCWAFPQYVDLREPATTYVDKAPGLFD
jgi:hypothetical protein